MDLHRTNGVASGTRGTQEESVTLDGTGLTSLEGLLEGSSRTFALSIPLLPEPLRQETTIAYLLFRVADTFEDEPVWSTTEKVQTLATIQSMLSGESPEAAISAVAEGIKQASLSDPGYTRLLDNMSGLAAAFTELSDEAQAMIGAHLSRTIDGMSEFLQRENPPATVEEVQEYCYYVAGIVGELLTDLFAKQSPSLADARAELDGLAPAFGEALQLVNILRDVASDADAGRRFVPQGPEHEKLFELAELDLARASSYVRCLESHGADAGILAFNTLNLLLAFETLERVRHRGAGVKIGRDRVRVIYKAVWQRMYSGQQIGDLLPPVRC